MSRVRIETKGPNINTRLWIDDQEIRDITGLHISPVSKSSFAEYPVVTITLLARELVVELDDVQLRTNQEPISE